MDINDVMLVAGVFGVVVSVGFFIYEWRRERKDEGEEPIERDPPGGGIRPIDPWPDPGTNMLNTAFSPPISGTPVRRLNVVASGYGRRSSTVVVDDDNSSAALLAGVVLSGAMQAPVFDSPPSAPSCDIGGGFDGGGMSGGDSGGGSV